MYKDKKKEAAYLKNHKDYVKKYIKERKLEVYIESDIKVFIKDYAKAKNISVASFIKEALVERVFELGYPKYSAKG